MQEEAKAKAQEAVDFEQVVAQHDAKLRHSVAALAEVREEAEREGALAGPVDAPAPGDAAAAPGVDVKLEQQLGDVLGRHEKLRALLRGRACWA